ncbi:MAG TPA: M23 family metallopeptidase [Nocardioides sp.]|nr:M23 family metallopeptidase [Nocardioides sp.]
MANHRADHRAPRRRSAAVSVPAREKYVGKRVAGREAGPLTRMADVPLESLAAPQAEAVAPVPAAPAPLPAFVAAPAPVVERAPTVELPALRDIPLYDPLVDTGSLRAVQAGGKRRAVRHEGARGPLIKGLPSMPVAVGVATLAVAVGGVLTSTAADPQLAAGTQRPTSANALSGSFGTAAVSARTETVSRDSDRDALAAATGSDVVAQTERNAEERTSALGLLAKDAEKEAAEIALNRWMTPILPGDYHLTARFGQYGLWSNFHTGLDFAAPTGTHIRSIANGVVTSTAFDGAYGNKTVVTLDDGTELWYCHQTAFGVHPGETVRAGDLIGYVGSTGHVTGPHVHIEVRPGGGDPVDPYAAFVQHGVTP